MKAKIIRLLNRPASFGVRSYAFDLSRHVRAFSDKVVTNTFSFPALRGTNHMRNKYFFSAGFTFLFVFLIGSCMNPASSTVKTYTLSGTVTGPVAEVTGKFSYLKLVAGKNAPLTDEAVYSCVSTQFSGTKASYSASGIVEGVYTGWIIIDMNSTGGGSLMPDSGDYVTKLGHNFNLTADETFDIPGNAWRLQN